MLGDRPQAVLRIKGLAAFSEHPGRVALVQAVQQRFSPVRWLDDWPSEDHTSRLVVIGRGLDFDQLERDFRAVCLA
jgi:G3E family GTPase